MAVGSYPGRTDCTHRVARAAIRLPAKTTPSRLGAKRVQAGRHRDEFPRGQGPWPKAGPPYPKRRAQTPKVLDKVLDKVLAQENTFGFSAISSREPDFRVPYSICQHALVHHRHNHACRHQQPKRIKPFLQAKIVGQHQAYPHLAQPHRHRRLEPTTDTKYPYFSSSKARNNSARSTKNTSTTNVATPKKPAHPETQPAAMQYLQST